MTTSIEPVAYLRRVNKIYANGVDTQVLFDIDLTVNPGELIAVVGASGSGKTTLLNIMGLLDTPTSGEVVLNGRDVGKLEDNDRALLRRDFLGFIFQFHYLLPEFTALENVLMPCRLKGGDAESRMRARAVELLRQVGLGERLAYRPSQLSGGQQQRAAIVRALVNDPVLVLADEPTGNLDTASGRAVFELIRDLNRSTGKAVLMVTHDEHFAAQADRMVRIVDGRIVTA